MSSLPTELLIEILQQITRKRDLAALCLASRRLQAEAESLLYHTLEATSRLESEVLCRRIIESPRIRPLVRSLTIASSGRDRDLTPPEAYWSTIAAALSHLPALDVLRISDIHRKDTAWVLADCRATLREFECDFALDGALVAFLARQPRMAAFQWMCTFPMVASGVDGLPCAQQGFLPALREFSTNLPSIALRVVPSHALTHLWISGTLAAADERAAFAPDSGLFTQELRSLRLNFPYNKQTLISTLSVIAQTSPRIRSLGFLPYFTTQEAELIATLAQFKHLETLALWNVITAETSRALAEACPSLRLVACLHYSYSHEYVFLPVNPTGVPHPVHDPDYRLWRDV
ncbi:hypothetical protein WOLCODRAFT_102612 [Wolfiporia cocos MD-104 SS10]|uniref:F-box domain-containing protein n=1 Tax=Wolfiporia cocos (strain MD-104) TaxID=742152 RepID=A0A2H3JV46_WOLCO|nr:hypothetical protein WOLCODRAFT_102612 [Wolfiporia cocos MD-104 SS10]